ncbi:HAD family hydrolase [Cupriavidus sp. WKF15]|uniref:HAD family hydrolase n=1 Tax=Cupriavidus TaxID=106589 RepID=UPI002159E578|nr:MULTISPECIES: HAD family hydrolase [Cupriavidus]WER50481.1 HAD family hydrolase [Cupriavidus sp. WKF15]
MTNEAKPVFLLDCDNTLFDNDRLQADLEAELDHVLGIAGRIRYWQIFESLRTELGYADYLGAVQRLRFEVANDMGVLQLSAFLLDYPFAARLYPAAMDVIEYLGAWGNTVLLTDGDVVLQPHKLKRSGLWQAVGGRVLVYVHKETKLHDIEQRHPAQHYVLVDDKPRILATMKREWRDRVVTVFPRQGHYANDRHALDARNATPAPDLTIERIGDLLHYGLPALRDAARAADARAASAQGKSCGVHRHA